MHLAPCTISGIFCTICPFRGKHCSADSDIGDYKAVTPLIVALDNLHFDAAKVLVEGRRSGSMGSLGLLDAGGIIMVFEDLANYLRETCEQQAECTPIEQTEKAN